MFRLLRKDLYHFIIEECSLVKFMCTTTGLFQKTEHYRGSLAMAARKNIGLVIF